VDGMMKAGRSYAMPSANGSSERFHPFRLMLGGERTHQTKMRRRADPDQRSFDSSRERTSPFTLGVYSRG